MNEDKIFDSLKEDIAMNKFKRKLRREERIKSGIKGSLAVVVCLLSISGMVFAKDISRAVYENYLGTGNGIGKAMEEGYIANANMDYEVSNTQIENAETGEKIEDAETSIKVNEIVMDDFNLSLTFKVELSEKASQIIKAKDIMECNFPDLIISDENDVVLFIPRLQDLEKWAKARNLNYDINTVPDDKIINTGVNFFTSKKEENSVEVVYNIYTGNTVFPKSKKLNFELSKIKVSPNETISGEEEITFTGDWKFSVDVPEKMYNRTSMLYKQVKTSNNDFNVVGAVVRDTGTEISLTIKSEKRPEMPTSPMIEFYRTLPEDDELVNIDLYNYLHDLLMQTDEAKEYYSLSRELTNVEVEIVNENGQSFGRTEGPRENGSTSLGDDEIVRYNGVYDLTKYDLTDKITAKITYRGNTEEVVLEKVEEE